MFVEDGGVSNLRIFYRFYYLEYFRDFFCSLCLVLGYFFFEIKLGKLF